MHIAELMIAVIVICLSVFYDIADVPLAALTHAPERSCAGDF